MDLLESEGSIEAVTLGRIAEATHYATSVVHYHTGGIESLRDELFQMLAIEFSSSMLTDLDGTSSTRSGHDAILAAGQWVKDHPASTRFLAGRESKEIREPGLSAAKAVFGIDLANDPDGLSITRFIHRSFFNPTTLILDAESGARSIDEPTIVALGMLTWRHLRSSLAVLAARQQSPGRIAPETFPLPGITSPAPRRSEPPRSDATSAEELEVSRTYVMQHGLDGLDPETAAAIHTDLVRELWHVVLDTGTGGTVADIAADEDAIARFVAWGTAHPSFARVVFYTEGRSGVPAGDEVLSALLPGLAIPDPAREPVAFHVSRHLAGVWETLPLILDDDDAIAAVAASLLSLRTVLEASGVVSCQA